MTAFLIGIASAWFFRRMGRNPYLCFVIGFLFGIFGIFAIFFATKKPKEAPKPPEPILGGPKDKLWYYLTEASEQQGPMSHDALTKVWREGKLSPSTYLWYEGLPEWKPLKEILTS